MSVTVGAAVLPSTMRAIVVDELRGPDGMVERSVPLPDGAHPFVRDGRLLIEVHAAGIAFPDVLMSHGRLQIATPSPYVAGAEVAGVVVESEPGSPFAPGDRVASSVLLGAMAEYALGRSDYTIRLPDSMSFATGAALPINYGTSWLALDRAAFRAGEVVLVLGAAGGVGTATLDLVRAMGGRSIAIVSTDEKARVAEASGASHVLRTTDDWLGAVRDLTDGAGVDVVVDPVGGDRFVDHLRALRIGGRLLVIGFAGGSIPSVKLNRLLLRNLSLIGFDLDVWDEADPGIVRRTMDEVGRLAAVGTIAPYVGRRFPLSAGADAVRALERREALGKVVVDVRGPGRDCQHERGVNA